MEKNLKSKQYYSDLYDRFTVDECRSVVEQHKNSEYPKGESGKQLTKEGKEALNKMVSELHLYYIKGERYLQKDEKVREWMDADRAKDELIEKAMPLEGITCLLCGGEMTVESKDIYSGLRGKKGGDRVLMFYKCESGCRRRLFFDDGEEWVSKPDLCDKCGAEYAREDKRDKEKVITVYNCSSCGHSKTEELDLSIKEEEIDKNFEADKVKFCMSSEEGQEYLGQKMNLREVSKMLDKFKEKEKNKKLYDKVAKIQKLKVPGLLELLDKELTEQKYVKLEFGQPEIGREVAVSFTVQDAAPDREDYDSRQQLKKLINKTLENTNWRLMSDGITCRLGILSGRLRGYEGEEELVRLVKKKK
jgi:hypothetical protein